MLQLMFSEHEKFNNENETSFEKSSHFTETLEFSPEKIQTQVEQLKTSNTILKEHDEQLQRFIDNAPAAIAMFDNEMNYISASMRWIEDYNLKEQELRGKSHYDIFPEVTDELKEVHQRCLHGAVEHGEGKFIRMKGNVQWIKWEVQPWYLPSDDIGGIIIFSEDITRQKQIENSLKESLYEKEVLLKEIHHRVKNNLQIISSLLNLQETYVKENLTAINVLQESQNRVLSMAIIHEMLCQSKNLSQINFTHYIKNLVSTLFSSYGTGSNISTTINVENIYLNIETAVPCGLIISELVSNSLKYAFPHKKGRITISLKAHDKKYELIIGDDGIGFPEELDFKNIGSSLGLKLVNSLVNQLDGTIKLDRNQGTKYTIQFTEQLYKNRL